MTRPPTPTAQYLYDAIEASDRTQREIAREAGFTNANILSMMKSGETKIPINRISALANALQVSPAIFLQTALRAYHPELYEVVTA